MVATVDAGIASLTPLGLRFWGLSIDPTTVVDWFDRNGRDLPWRRTRDPWAILVAELMLQQTQVARVREPWVRFLVRFPDPAACAAVSAGEVIEAWAGLGYNRRAVNLHRSASLIVADFGGSMPTELADLLALPGIGPYTARAVRVFACETDDGVVDTNVARILARHQGRRLRRRQAQELADSLVPAGDGWRWNQALLDIGAGTCRARQPDCERCPLLATCRWGGGGRPPPDPAVTSAGVSGPQSPFEGSDRQGRGRLVDALRRGPVARADLAAVMGWPHDPDRAERVAATVERDGLAVRLGTTLTLPPVGADREQLP
jgi:A/G-specific adenine glycosylase